MQVYFTWVALVTRRLLVDGSSKFSLATGNVYILPQAIQATFGACQLQSNTEQVLWKFQKHHAVAQVDINDSFRATSANHTLR